MRDPLGPGIEPMSPALAGRFFTTESPRNPKKEKTFKNKMQRVLEKWEILKKKRQKRGQSIKSNINM